MSKFLSASDGFIVNPLAATIFLALILIVVVYSTLDQAGTLTRLWIDRSVSAPEFNTTGTKT